MGTKEQEQEGEEEDYSGQRRIKALVQGVVDYLDRRRISQVLGPGVGCLVLARRSLSRVVACLGLRRREEGEEASLDLRLSRVVAVVVVVVVFLDHQPNKVVAEVVSLDLQRRSPSKAVASSDPRRREEEEVFSDRRRRSPNSKVAAASLDLRRQEEEEDYSARLNQNRKGACLVD